MACFLNLKQKELNLAKSIDMLKTCSRELKAKDDMITSKCKYLENRCKELNSQAKNSKERREETSIQLNKIYKNYNIKIKKNDILNSIVYHLKN